MTQQIINVGEVANDGTGESLRTAFEAVNNNFSQIWSSGPVNTNVVIANNVISTIPVNTPLILAPGGIGNVQSNAHILPGISGVYDLGSPTKKWDAIYGDYLYGNGYFLTGIQVANVGSLVNGNSNVVIAGPNGVVTISVSGVPNVATISTTGVSVSGAVTASGNVSANYFVGNGSLLTGIVASGGASIDNGNSNVRIGSDAGNVTVGVSGVGNVVVFTPTGLSVANTLTAGAVSVAGNVVALDFQGNGAGLASITGANVTGNVPSATYAYTASQAGLASLANRVIDNAQPNITSVGTLTSLTSTGNVTANYFVGNGRQLTGIVVSPGTSIINGSSNVVVNANGNVTIGTAGTGNVAVFAPTGVSVTGLISATGNVTANYFIGNGSLLTGLSASNVNANALVGTNLSSNVIYSSLQTVGNLSYVNVDSNVTAGGRFIGSGAGLTNLPGANVTGVVPSATTATTAATVTTAAQPNITSVGTLTSLTATGNIAGNYFIGNGSLLTGIAASSANANALVGSTLSSNVLYSSLQTVGNLLSLNVNGNVITTGTYIGSGTGLTNIPGANVVGTVANATYATTAGTAYSVSGANVSGTVANAIYAVTAGNATTATVATYANIANSVSGSNVSGTVANAAYATAAGSATTANTAATVTTAAQPNITSVGTLTSVSVSGNATAGNVLTDGKISAVGNVTGNYFIGNGALLTGIVSNASANANALVGSTLSSNVLFSSLTTVGNLLSLNVDGNVVTTGRFSGSGAGLTNIPASNISGAVANAVYANTAGLATTATIANIAVTVTANAQPNITSVGTLTSVSVAGNASVGRLNIGQANLYLTNTNPPVLTIQADATQFTSNIEVFNTVKTFDVVANSTVSAIGNVIGGNLVTAGNATASYFVGNGRQLTGIVATSVGVLPSLSVTGNIVTGNLNTSGIISAAGNIKTVGNVSGNYFIGNGALLTGITVSAGTSIVNGNSNVVVGANGNVTVGVTGTSNVSVFTPEGVEVNGLVSATGNIAGNYLLGNGALITGLPAGYSNADVANYLPTYTGNLVSLTGPVTTTSNITGGNLLTGGVISATGNVTGNYILGNGALLTGVITSVANINNGTSNVTVVSPGGNISVGVGGTGNVAVFASTGEYITGLLSASGNVTGNYFIGNGSQLTGVAASSVNANALIGNTLSSNVLYSSLTTVGTLANLSATGNVTGGNVLTAGLISATGNITSGNVSIVGGTLAFANANIIQDNPLDLAITGAYQISVKPGGGTYQWTFNNNGSLSGPPSASGYLTLTGNVIGGNLLTGGLVSAASNVTGGNLLTSGLISATGNIIGGNVNTNAIQPVSGGLTISTTSGNLTLQPSGNIVLANTIINGVAYPQQDTDAASKIYVDNLVSTGLSYHPPVAAATTTTLSTTTGGSITYAQPNGVANGIGALLTTTGSFNLIDTANVQTVGTRILVKNEGNAVYNGVYTWANATNIIRSTDTDQYGPDSIEDLSLNDYFFVQGGNVNKGGAWVVSAPVGTIVFGTSNITFSQFSSSQTYTANTDAGISLAGTQINAKVDQNTTAFDGGGNIIVKAGANLTTPNIGAATGTSLSVTSNVTGGNLTTAGAVTATGNVTGGNINTAGLISAAGNVIGNYFIGNGSQLTGVAASSVNANALIGNTLSSNVLYSSLTQVGTLANLSVTANVTGGNLLTAGLVSAAGNVTGNYILGNGSQLTGILGSNVNMGSNTAGQLVSNAVTLTTSTTVTNGIALLNQVLGKLVPPAPPNFPNSTSITLSGISSYRMANITQVDNTPGANKAVAAGTSVANVLRVATYATNTISTVGPGDSGTIVAVRNGANVGNVTLNAGATPSGNGTYGSNLVISNNYDYHTANANIAAGFWYVFSAAVSGSSAPGGWNELYIADTSTANTNTTVWYYDNSSPSAPSFSSTTMTPPGSANLLYSSTIPHYTNNNNFTIAFNVANISGNTYPVANTLASGSSGGSFAAPATINYNASNIGSNVLSSFASASANTTVSVTTGFGGSATGPSMSVNNSYSSGTLTLTTALGNTVLYKSGTATAIDESNVVINTTIGTGSGNAYRIINPGTGNTPTFTGSEAAFNSQSSTLQTYDATVVGSGTAGVLKHDQTNYATGYLPAGPNLSSGRTGTQYFTMKFVRTAVSKFDVKYTGNIAGMWVALPGSVIDSSSSANGWINMAVAYGGAGYPGVNSPGNGSDGCAVGGIVTLNTSVTNSSKTCTFGTVSSSSTASNEIYVRIALTAGQSVTALTLETASN